MKIIKGFLIGAVIGLAIMMALAFGSRAMAQEAVPVYPAPSGMQDRGFNYKSPQTVETIIYHEVSYGPSLSQTYRCDKYNRKLTAMIKMIARQIAEDPSVGHIYAPALVTINEVWCTK